MSATGPDQPVGWVIALACFSINFIMAGLARTAGVLFVALIELYGASRESASTPFTIRVCLRNMSGPLIGLLGQKYGIRKVTTAGGAVAGLGSILCYFAPNITYITLFWGVIHGTGFGLSTVIHMMMINQYFDKYKATALGLGYSGDCFGTFAFPVIIGSLLNNYDIKGTFLILGGIVLHVIPLAMLLRKPPWLKANGRKDNFSKNILAEQGNNLGVVNSEKNSSNMPGIQNSAFNMSNESLCHSNKLQKEEADIVSIGSNDPSVFQNGIPNHLKQYRQSISLYSSTRSCKCHVRRKTTDLPASLRENVERHNSLPPLFEKDIMPPGKLSSVELDQNTIEEGLENDCFGDDDICRYQDSACTRKRRNSSLSQMAHDLVHRVRTASFASQCAQDGYIAIINEPQTEKEDCDKITADNFDHNNAINSQLDISQPDKVQPAEKLEIIPVGQNNQSPSVMKTLLRTNTKPIFILISMSMAVYCFIFVGVFTIIIDYATDCGISQDDGNYLIIGFSVTDLIGRLSFGQVLDRKLIRMKNYAGMTITLMGVLVAIIPLNRSFNFMLICMCTYGFVQGGTAIMFPILVSYYMEKSEESVAMGSLNFYGGLLTLSLAPMIGFFRDNTGSYDMVFYLQGCIVLVVGIIWQFEPLILSCWKETKPPQLKSVKNMRQ